MCCHKFYGALGQVFLLLQTLIWKQLPSLLLGSPSLWRVLVWGSTTWLRGSVTSWWAQIHYVFWWILLSSYLPRFPWLMSSTSCGGVAFLCRAACGRPRLRRVQRDSSYALPLCESMYSLFFTFLSPTLHFSAHGDKQLWWLCQGAASPATVSFVGPPHLPWLVYAYGPDGFAREHPVGRNLNVMGYPFLASTQVVSSFPSLSCLFFSLISWNLF